MKLIGSTRNKITKDKNGEHIPHLQITEVVLVHCNIVNNDCQLLLWLTNHIFLKTFNSEYDQIKVWLTNQNSKPLEMEDRINLTTLIK